MSILAVGTDSLRMTRQAWMRLRRAPLYAAGVIAIVALGLGATGGLASLVASLWLRQPRGVAAPEAVRRLYAVRRDRAALAARSIATSTFSFPSVQSMRAAANVPMAAYAPLDSVPLELGDRRLVARVAYASGSYFDVLGVVAARGRVFGASDDVMGTPAPIVVVSHRFWHEQLGGDPAVVGTRMRVGDLLATVIGVAPADFDGVDLSASDAWVPLSSMGAPSNLAWSRNSGARRLHVVVRADQGPDTRRATSVMTTAYQSYQRAERWPDSTATIEAGSLLEALGPETQRPEFGVSTRAAAVVFIIFLIACANVANLVVVRTTARRRELAVRIALGASRAHVTGEVVTEFVLLAFVGGALAVLVAASIGEGVRQWLIPGIRWTTPVLDPALITGILAIAVLIGLVIGCSAVFASGTPAVASVLAEGGHGMNVGVRGTTVRSINLAIQSCLATMLLLGAGLFGRSLGAIRDIDLGYTTDDVTMLVPTLRAPLPAAALDASFDAIARELRGVPGVRAAAVASAAPMWTANWIQFFAAGWDSTPRLSGRSASINAVSPEFFDATGLRVLRGRALVHDDGVGAAPVAVVNEAMAGRLWPRLDPLGQCLYLMSRTSACVRVVGVAENAHLDRVIEGARMQYYIPLAQVPRDAGFAPTTLIVRGNRGQTSAIETRANDALARGLPGVSSVRMRRLDEIVNAQVRPWRLGSFLFGGLGILALLVAAVGVHSTVAYTVSQRARDIGLRVALGARDVDILDVAMATGVRSVLVGAILGLVAAFWLVRLIAAQLYGVEPHDAAVFIGAPAVLVAVSLLAAAWPAMAAARANPMEVLKRE
jgi:putative ABC transport system permease protein